MWHGLVPYRIEIFTWFAILGRLNTRSKLAAMGIISRKDSNCILCGAAQECHNHLFLHCTLSWEIWVWWCSLWNLNWVPPLNLRHAFDQWHYPSKGIFFKKVWAASFFIILWTIWKERNGRIFENQSSTLSQLKDLILLRLSWWIKGWGALSRTVQRKSFITPTAFNGPLRQLELLLSHLSPV